MFELKPCPFCNAKLIGIEEIMWFKEEWQAKKHIVYTHPHKCCVLDYKRFYFYSNPWQVDAWNMRAEDGK